MFPRSVEVLESYINSGGCSRGLDADWFCEAVNLFPHYDVLFTVITKPG